jgi:hypothetical protein
MGCATNQCSMHACKSSGRIRTYAFGIASPASWFTQHCVITVSHRAQTAGPLAAHVYSCCVTTVSPKCCCQCCTSTGPAAPSVAAAAAGAIAASSLTLAASPLCLPCAAGHALDEASAADSHQAGRVGHNILLSLLCSIRSHSLQPCSVAAILG